MTLHLGKVKPGSTVYIPFDTFAGATGASITMTGLATSDILIYRNGNTTQRASTTGFTLLDTDGIDFDAITGIHGISIDLSSNATADFYTAGAMYWVVISTITVDGQTVSFVLATFTIGYESAILDTTIATLASQTSFTLTAGPAEDDALNGCEVVIHDIASAVQAGRAIISDYTGSTRTVTLVAGTTFTAAAGDNISVFLSALQPTVQGRALDVSTGGEAGLDWANIGSPTTAQNLSATNIDVDQVVASVSGNVGGNVTGSVGSVATGGITSGSFASGAITNTAIAADAIGAAELAADAVAEIADAVWDEDATAHQTQGTFGQAIGDPGSDSDTIWALANTNLDAAVSSRASQTSVNTIDDFLDTEIAAIITTLGTPAGASVSADIAAIEAQTDDIGAAGAGLTAIPWNAAWDAEVQSEVDDALVARNLTALVLASGTADSGSTTTMVDAARTEGDNDYWKGRLLLFTSGTIAGQCAIITDFVAATDTFTFAPALTQAVSTQTYVILPGISVWDDTLAEHLASGSTGNALNAAGSAGDPWGTALPGAYGAGSAGFILGTNLDATVSSRASQTSVNTIDDFLDTEIADIQARLPAALVSGRMDSSVGAMAANTITSSALATTAVDEITDAVWDEVLTGATHNVTNSAGRRLRQLAGGVVHSGTAQAGSLTNITLDTGASSVDGTYDPSLVRIVGGTGSGQTRQIIQYTGSTRVASVGRDWRTAPDNTSEFEILSAPNLQSTNEGLAQGGAANTITLNVDAIAIDNMYTGQTVVIRTGTGQDQSRIITAYNGTTKVATVATPWDVNPVAGSGYMILPTGRAQIVNALPNTLTAAALASDAVAEIQAGLSTLTAAQVNTEVDTALADVGLTTMVTGRIDAAVSSRLASASYTTPPTAIENADALLKRDWTAVTGEAARSVLNALRFLRNKWSVSGATLTVTTENDTTTAWQATLTSDAAAEPVTGSDPS